MNMQTTAGRPLLKARFFHLMLALLGALALSAPVAHASSVTVVYTGDNDINGAGHILANVGDQLTFDIMFDFSDASTIGGNFDLLFDPSALSFTQPILYNPSLCLSNADCRGLGGPTFNEDRVWMSFGIFNPLQEMVRYASITLTVTSLPSDGAFVGTGPTSDPFGVSFISGEDFLTPIDVDYNQIGIAAVPLPAAIWSMMLGLGALLGLGRSSGQAG